MCSVSKQGLDLPTPFSVINVIKYCACLKDSDLSSFNVAEH